MKNSARGDSSTGSELKAVEEACREASRTVEPCAPFKSFRIFRTRTRLTILRNQFQAFDGNE